MTQIHKALIAFLITFIFLSCYFNAKEDQGEISEAHVIQEPSSDKKTEPTKTVIKSIPPSFPAVKFPTSGTKHQVFLDQKYELMKQILTEYENNSIDSIETKEITSKALKDYLDRIHNKKTISKQHIVSLCKAIIKTKPKDPLSKAFIQYYLRVVSYTKLDKIDHYSPFVQMYIELISAYYLKHPTYKQTVKQYTDQQHTNPRAYWWMLTKLDLSHSEKQIKKINAILEESTSSWVQKMCLGIKHFYLSGRERNGQRHPKGFDRAKYHTHSTEAIKYFEQAYKLNPKLPEPTLYLIDLDFDIHKQTYWLNKSLEIEIDNPSAFYNFIWLTESTSDYTTKYDSLMCLADECMKNESKSKLIPLYALDVIYKIYLQKQIDPKIIQTNELDQKIISYFSKNPDITLPNTKGQYYRSILLLMLINTNQFNFINEFQNLIETGEINWKIVDKEIKDFELYKSIAFVNESPHQKQIQQLLSKYFEDFRFQDTETSSSVSISDFELGVNIQESNTNPRLKPIINYLTNHLKFHYTLHSGEWLDIDFVKHRPYYITYNDQYKIESPTSLYVDSYEKFYITFTQKLPQQLEVEYDLEHISKSNSRFSLFGFSVYAKEDISDSENKRKMSLLADLHASMTYIYIPNKDWKWSPFVPRRSKEAKINIKLWPNTFQYDFNKGDYFYCTNSGLEDIKKIRFGTRFKSSSKGIFRLKNLRIRKHNTPIPQMGTPEEHENYYTTTVDMINQRGVKRFLANYYMQKKKYNKSLALYKQSIDQFPMSSTAMELGDILVKMKKYTEASDAYLQVYKIGDHPVLKDRGFNLYIDTVSKYPKNENLDQAYQLIEKLINETQNANEKFKLMIHRCKLETAQMDFEASKKTMEDLEKSAKASWQKNQIKSLKKFLGQIKKAQAKLKAAA